LPVGVRLMRHDQKPDKEDKFKLADWPAKTSRPFPHHGSG
jgi:hypothetical protein